MKPIANYQPQQGMSLQSNRPSVTSEWKRQVAEFVTQCFETYPRYGDDALSTKIKTFVVGLEDYSLDEISYAFRVWLKDYKKMPVPADIVDIAKSGRKHASQIYTKAVPLPKPKGEVVPWAYLNWKQIQEQGLMTQIEEHLVKLTKLKGKEWAEGYLNYLKNGPQNQQ